MRRLFFTIFLWFWLTLFGVAVFFTAVVIHGGLGNPSVVRLAFHDLGVFTIAGTIFCYLVIRYLTKPLQQLGEAAAGIAEGRIETRVDPSLRNRRDEIADLACNFDRMAERIEALVTGQRRLLGDVSHELRSPLSRLIVALSLVKQGPAAETAENLERIGLEAQRLDTLIGQLLALTRIDSGVDRGSSARFDLTNVVQEVANDGDFEARARNRRVSIVQADSCTLDGFEEVVRSAVEKVVRNEIRHTTGRYGGYRRGDSGERCARANSRHRSRPRCAGQHAHRDFPAVPADRERNCGWRGIGISDRGTRRERSSGDDTSSECSCRRPDCRDRSTAELA